MPTDPSLAPAPLLKTRDAARWLGVSERSLWTMSAPRGPLPVVHVGHSIRFRLADLEAWTAAQAAASLAGAK